MRINELNNLLLSVLADWVNTNHKTLGYMAVISVILLLMLLSFYPNNRK